MTAQRKLSEEDFQAARDRIGRFTLDSIDIAKAVLVQRRKKVEVAAEHGITRQRVNQLVQKVLQAIDRIPANWEHVEVWLPPDQAKQVRAMAQESLERAQEREQGA